MTTDRMPTWQASRVPGNQPMVNGTRPDAAQIATARAQLARHINEATSLAYAYAVILGTLQGRISLLDDDHAGCRKSGCATCGHIRALNAYLRAFKEVRES